MLHYWGFLIHWVSDAVIKKKDFNYVHLSECKAVHLSLPQTPEESPSTRVTSGCEPIQALKTEPETAESIENALSC